MLGIVANCGEIVSTKTCSYIGRSIFYCLLLSKVSHGVNNCISNPKQLVLHGDMQKAWSRYLSLIEKYYFYAQTKTNAVCFNRRLCDTIILLTWQQVKTLVGNIDKDDIK